MTFKASPCIQGRIVKDLLPCSLFAHKSPPSASNDTYLPQSSQVEAAHRVLRECTKQRHPLRTLLLYHYSLPVTHVHHLQAWSCVDLVDLERTSLVALSPTAALANAPSCWESLPSFSPTQQSHSRLARTLSLARTRPLLRGATPRCRRILLFQNGRASCRLLSLRIWRRTRIVFLWVLS